MFSYKYRIKVEGEIIEKSNKIGPFDELLGDYNIEADNLYGKILVYKTTGDIMFGQITKELTTCLNDINKLNFELVNLREIGSEVIHTENTSYRGFSYLELNGWVIELRLKNSYKKLYEELKEYGGFAQTHEGTVYRKDKSSFDFMEVRATMEELFSYLSFTCGRRIYPSYYKGDKNGNTVYQRYEARLIDQWSTPHTWYPKIEKEIYQDLFEGYYSLWQHEVWKPSKNILLGTYLECFSQVTLENRISSIQIALELITRVYLVNYKCVISNRKFKKMDTKERFKLLCTNMEISLEHPIEFLERRNGNFNDPISFFVDIRNSLVHSKKKIELSHNNLVSAYYIGLWLLELCFLRLFNYYGKYKNRLSKSNWEGDVDLGGCYYLVPWHNH
ncbi:hypothetical protein ACGTN9_17535 [Halobacillus sp. MO56]